MSQRIVVLLAALCFAAPGFAIEEENEMGVAEIFVAGTVEPPEKMPAACQGLNLDAAQMKDIKDAHFAFAKEKNIHAAHLKNAIMDYLQALGNTQSQRQDGMKAAMDAKSALEALGGAKVSLDLRVMYEILKPEQRAPALRCAMAMMKAKWQEKLRKLCQRRP